MSQKADAPISYARIWAKAHGIAVPATGRFLPPHVMDQWRAAGSPVPGQGWSRALGAWADHLSTEGQRSPATIATYRKHVEWLAAAAQETEPNPWRLPPGFIAWWLSEQRWAWSADMRRKVLVSLRCFYAFGIAHGLCERSPVAGIAGPGHRASGPRRDEPTEHWREPIGNFLATLEAAARRPGLVDQRRWWLTKLSKSYADPWAVTSRDLALWLSREDYAPNTKRLGLSSVRNFYAWAERAGHIDRSPATNLPTVRLPRALPRPATDEAVTTALARADDRTRLALSLALLAGLRRAEIACLHTRDIKPDHLHVTGKGGNERRVPLHPALADILRIELAQRATRRMPEPGSGWGTKMPPVNGWVFPSQRAGHLTPAHVGRMIRSCLPDGFTTHTLRHRFATQAYQSGRDLRAVQELLGHTKPETTARYAAVPEGALAEAVHNLPTPW